MKKISLVMVIITMMAITGCGLTQKKDIGGAETDTAIKKL